jgi:hypothetical protein
MGNYNPHAPYILGQEWAPIRDEDVTYAPAVNSVELGHQFFLPQAARVRDARYYIHEFPPTPGTYQTTMFNIYPRGTEDLTGPIKSVLIPCNNGGISGGAGISLSSATSVAQALQNPGDLRYVGNTYNAGVQTELSMFFAVNSYPQLADKRILNVSLVYTGYACDADSFGNGCRLPLIDPDPSTAMTLVSIANNAGNLRSYLKFIANNLGSLWQLSNTPDEVSGNPATNQTFGVLNLGDVNPYWDTTAAFFIPSPAMPWRYVDLQRFEASAGVNRLNVHVNFQVPATTQGSFTNNGRIVLEYAALRVIYCDEQRVAYGGYISAGAFDTNYGANPVTIRDRSFNTDPVLPVGDYTVTLATVNPGDLNFGSGLNTEFPKLNGLRQLYALPEQRGVQINIPTPLENHLDETFTKVETQVLPQLSLHTSGGPITAVHAYGRQVTFPVYGSVTPEQEIYDDLLPGAMVFDQVRFYARRFGDTSVPLEIFGVSGTAGSASITPAAFDALNEIIHGWKQVTLTLSPTSTMGALAPPAPRFRFGATGELAGNRWEVLGASAPALSGIPGNLYNLVPTPNQLYEATYQPPGGSQAELSWQPQGIGSPPVTAVSDDDSSDAVLMFAQSMPTITGFSVATATQTLTGIGLDCGVNPCCIPSALLYNRITWPLPVNTGVASDNFDRTVAAGGWGTASDGGVWTVAGTAGNFSVNGSNGIISPSATATQQIATHAVSGPDQDVRATIRINGTSEGTGSLRAGVVARFTDANNFYTAELWYTQNATAELHIRKVVGGVNTDLVSMVLATMNPNTVAYRFIDFQVRGQFLMAKIWGADSAEPDWMLVTTDTSLTTGNNAGAYARDDTTAAAPNSMFFENFSVQPPDYWFGSYELQRMDTVDTDWQTIMRATSPGTTGFSDFEARVGIASSYRIRGVDVYDFVGPWSSTVTITIPSPGASGGCISQGHVLLFSTNERQDGSSNLAYSSVWEGQVSEDFTFPESGFVQLQAMYNKDFFTAFRPTERGGEQFQRTVLVQAAAISPPTLADFTSLRDMAWDDVSYICVRDEGGNRWFATVIVPSGRVLHNRKLYLAPVQIIEVTDTPSEADPS